MEELEQKVLSELSNQDFSDQWMKDWIGGGEAPAAAPSPASAPGEVEAQQVPRLSFSETMGNLASGSWNVVKAVTSDVTKGTLTELVPQAVSGMIDTANEMAKFMASNLEFNRDEEGNPILKAGGLPFSGKYKDTQPLKPEEVPQLPNIMEPGSAETVTGQISRFIGNYAIGTGIANQLTKLGMKPGVWKSFVNDVTAGFAFMDPSQQTEILKLLPDGMVKEFLVAPPEEEGSILERMKSAMIVGSGGLAFEGVKLALRGVKSIMRKPADPAIPATTPSGSTPAAKKEQRDWLVLGDPKGRLVEFDQQVTRDSEAWLARFESVDQNGPGGVELPKTLAKLNLEVINGPDDVMQAINDTAAFTKEKGIKTEAMRREAAFQLGMTVDDLLSGKTGRALDEDQIQAAGWILRSSAEQLVGFAREAVRTGSHEDKLRALRAWTLHRSIQETVEQASATTGRSLQAWKTFAQETGDQTKNLNETLQMIGNIQDLDDVIQKIAQAQSPSEAGRIVDAAAKATSREKFLNVWYNILLSSPASHVANTQGSAGSALWHVANRLVASGIGRARGAQPGERVEIGEAAANLYGMLAASKDAFRLAGKGLLQGEQTFGGAATVEKTSTMLGGRRLRTETWRTQGANLMDPDKPLVTVGNLTRTLLPLRWMGAEDDFMKWVLYRGELHALAYRDGVKHGLSGNALGAHIKQIMDNPTKAFDDLAVQRALEGTFNNPLGPAMSHLMRAIDGLNIPVQHTGLEIPVGRVIVPFIRTPANLIRWSYTHSPVAAMFPSSRISQELAAGGAIRDMAIAKMTTGSLLAGSVGEMVLSGRITGAGPSDPELNRAWRDAGNEPYSIRIGDRWFSYRRLSPVGDILGLTADGVEIMQYATEKANENIAVALSFAWANTFMNKTFFQGLTGIFEAMDEPETRGEAYLNRLFTSGVPSVVKTVERAVDPEYRMAFDFVSQLKSTLPGQSDDLPIQTDMWGRDRKAPGAYFGIPGTNVEMNPQFAGILSPVALREIKPEPIDTFLWENRIQLRKPGRVQEFSANGVEVRLELTPEMYRRFLQLSGNELKDPNTNMGAKDTLNALITGNHPNKGMQDQFNGASTLVKEEIVRDITSKFRAAARKQLMVEFEDGLGNVVKQSLEDRAEQMRGSAPTVGGGAR